MFKFGSRKDLNTEYKVTIRLLDDTEVLQCDVQCDQKGQFLLDFVCNALNLVENDYFGLRYVDAKNQRHWLDSSRSIMKQVKGMNPIVFCFRVKFYPAEPHHLREEITRYQVFLQLRRDLLHGRLYCSQNDAALLAAYIIQSELGDYDPEEHLPNYISDFKLLLKQTPRLEDKVAELHQTYLRGQVPAISEINFLRKSCLLDTYGVDPHPVKDHKGTQMYLGINHVGILTFQGSRKTHHFKWPDIQKLNYEGKMFIIHLMFNEDSRTKKKHLIGFKCPSQAACHHLWKCAVEQRYFFTMNSSHEIPQITTGGGLFSRGCKFRYSGRVEKEVVEDTKLIKRDQPEFQRTLSRPASFRNKLIDGYANTSNDQTYDISTDCNSTQYGNHTLPNSCNATIECSNVTDVDMASPILGTGHLHNSLAPLEEEEDKSMINPPNSLPFDLTPSDENPTLSSISEAANDHAHHESNTDTESLYSEDENSEIRTSVPPHSSGRIEDFLPPDMRIPKRQFPVTPTYPLPPHVTVMRVFVLASLFVLLLLTCLLIVVMESDSSLFSDIRKLPEMIVLRREYYEPAKEYVGDRLSFLFK